MRTLVLTGLVVAGLVGSAAPAHAEGHYDPSIPLITPDPWQWTSGYACADAVALQLDAQCRTSAGFGPALRIPTMENPENREFCSATCERCCDEQESPANGPLEFACEAIFTAAGGGTGLEIVGDAFWTLIGHQLEEVDSRYATVWHFIHALWSLREFDLEDLREMAHEVRELRADINLSDYVRDMIIRGLDRGWSPRVLERWDAFQSLMRTDLYRSLGGLGAELLVGSLNFVRLALDVCGQGAELLTHSSCMNQCHGRYPPPDGFPDEPGRGNPDDPTRNGTNHNPWDDIPLGAGRKPTRCNDGHPVTVHVIIDGKPQDVDGWDITCGIDGDPTDISPIPVRHPRPGKLPDPPGTQRPGDPPTSQGGRPSAPLPPGVPQPPPTGTFRWNPTTGTWDPMPPAIRIPVPRESGTPLGITINACSDAGINPALCTTYLY